MLITIAPQSPVRVRLVSSVPKSAPNADAPRGVVKRSTGTAGVRATRDFVRLDRVVGRLVVLARLGWRFRTC
jgi:hypothetical protein